MQIKISDLEQLILSLVKTLLSKNLAFCVYRFPHENHLRVAVDPVLVCDKSGGDLKIAPFARGSAAAPFGLKRLRGASEIQKLLDQIDFLPDSPLSYGNLPVEIGREGYNQQIRKYLKAIESGNVQKAILSRVIILEKPTHFYPADTFKRLVNRYPGTLAYLFYHQKGGMWMGATPELLFRKEGDVFFTLALAGTQPRKEDGLYTWRPKETDEQAMVEAHIEDVFRKYNCKIRKKEGPHTVEAAHVAHLGTDYVFEGNEKVNTEGLLAALHPTPAVGGIPLDESLQLIKQTEGYDRAYYSGFISEESETGNMTVYVNLRCMQIGSDKVAVYVGGGITAGSDPDEEWNETIAKSKTMADVLQPAAEEYKHEVIG